MTELQLPDQQVWSDWLDAHPDAPEVGLVHAKKGSGLTTVTYAEAVEECLRRGWIDGQRKGRDEATFLQRYTPRTARSPWSQVNRGKVLALIEAGRMLPPGQAAIDAAKADGRWERAYAPASEITVPEDLQVALDAHPEAATFFATLTGSPRYAFLYRLQQVTRPETRARRIASYVEVLARGETLR